MSGLSWSMLPPETRCRARTSASFVVWSASVREAGSGSWARAYASAPMIGTGQIGDGLVERAPSLDGCGRHLGRLPGRRNCGKDADCAAAARNLDWRPVGTTNGET